LGQKSPDTSAIPLCVRHHRTGNDSYHKLGPRRFAQVHDLDILAIVRRLNTKPTIRIEGGVFVGHLEDQEYRLGPITEGLEPAIRKAIRLCAEDRLNTQNDLRREPA
jgi:hypothetical protein